VVEVANPLECRNCPLQKLPGLRPLEPQQLAYMQEFKRGERRYDRGEIVFSEGERTRHLFTVIEGVLIRFSTLEDGRRQIVNFMFPGDLVGLQGAFDEPASHSIEALLPARLCVFGRNSFEELVKQNPRLGYDITWLAAKEETALEGHIVSLGQRSARERVVYLAAWLLDRAMATGITAPGAPLDLPITQAQVADMLGLSLVHTNRTIRALHREGLVDWGPGELRIPDMEKASEFAGFDRANFRRRPFI